ncbi:hypothetical protein [Terrisporobacter glycolicus]|uniref:hypothetical protein n=1 Tax=Terrisporobacter glycolicus TaxID=36841 RepID=UPI000AE96BF2
MDISSKKFQTTANKFKKFSLAINILMILISILLIIFLESKKDAVLIIALIIFVKISLKYLFDNIKIVLFLQHIREISSTSYCISQILEKTDEKSEMSIILGKKYKKVLNEMHKVEKYTYETTIKGKQSENLANTVVEDVGKNLIKPVENIDKGIKSLKEGISYETLDYIEKEAYEMKDTINELFELSKAVTKTLEIDIQKIDIVSLTKQALVEYEGKLENKNIEIKKHIPNEKVFIDADGDKLWRVFEILLENILNHGKEKTRAYIEIKEEKEKVELSLINISRDELNMDTKNFYKLINENKNLGVPIAISLIEVQDGIFDIYIDGDMFKVNLMFNKSKNGFGRGEI